MKKTISRALCAALVLCILLTMAACGQSGRYVLTKASYFGITVDASELGLNTEGVYIELKFNGTGVICGGGEEYAVGWDSDSIWPLEDKSQTIDMVLEDGTLTIDYEGIGLIFEKK